MYRRIKNQNILTHHVRMYINGHCLIEAGKLKIEEK